MTAWITDLLGFSDAWIAGSGARILPCHFHLEVLSKMVNTRPHDDLPVLYKETGLVSPSLGAIPVMRTG